MFTGIVEAMGTVLACIPDQDNVHFDLHCPFIQELKIDQSLAHDGVCLTVVDIQPDRYRVTAIRETLDRTSLRQWKPGKKVNLERCLQAGARLDGHIVQGHVDTTAIVMDIQDQAGSWKFVFSHPRETTFLTVSKGSVCINGTSLTVVDSTFDSFSVVIIPYTWENTVFHQLAIGDAVNVEFDILGKYVQKLVSGK